MAGILPSNEPKVHKNEAKIIWLYGQPMAGKTSLASKIDEGNTLILSTDGNYTHLDTPAIRIKTYEDIESVFEALKTSVEYQTIVFDILEDFLEIVRSKVLSELKIKIESDAPHGSGWFAVRRAQDDFRRKTKDLPQKIILISHERVLETKTRIGTTKLFCLPNLHDRDIPKWTGYCSIVTRLVLEEKNRFLEIGESDSALIGNRTNIKFDAKTSDIEFINKIN